MALPPPPPFLLSCQLGRREGVDPQARSSSSSLFFFLAPRFFPLLCNLLFFFRADCSSSFWGPHSRSRREILISSLPLFLPLIEADAPLRREKGEKSFAPLIQANVYMSAPFLPLSLLPAQKMHHERAKGRGGSPGEKLVGRPRRLFFLVSALLGGGGGGGLRLIGLGSPSPLNANPSTKKREGLL